MLRALLLLALGLSHAAAQSVTVKMTISVPSSVLGSGGKLTSLAESYLLQLPQLLVTSPGCYTGTTTKCGLLEIHIANADTGNSIFHYSPYSSRLLQSSVTLYLSTKVQTTDSDTANSLLTYASSSVFRTGVSTGLSTVFGSTAYLSAISTSSSSSLGATISDSTPLKDDAMRMVQAAVAASVIISTAFAIAIIAYAHFLYPSSGSYHPSAMDQWKPRASKAAYVHFAGFLFLSLGVSAAIASIAMPWWCVLQYGGLTASYGGLSAGGSALLTGWSATVEYCALSVCTRTTYPTFLLYGAIIVYIGAILFLFPAWVMAAVAACRLRGVAVAGVAPAVGCCTPNLPAIQGLAWFGLIVVVVGAAIDWAIVGIFTSVLGVSSSIGTPGMSFLGFAVASLILAALLFSITGCCTLGHLPGLGVSATSCCCAERNPNQPAEGGAAAAAASGVAKPAVVILTPAGSAV